MSGLTDAQVDIIRDDTATPLAGFNISWSAEAVQAIIGAALKRGFVRIAAPHHTATTDAPIDTALEALHDARVGIDDGQYTNVCLNPAEIEALIAQRETALTIWGDFVAGGWDRPDDVLKDAFEFSPDEQRRAIDEGNKRLQAFNAAVNESGFDK